MTDRPSDGDSKIVDLLTWWRVRSSETQGGMIRAYQDQFSQQLNVILNMKAGRQRDEKIAQLKDFVTKPLIDFLASDTREWLSNYSWEIRTQALVEYTDRQLQPETTGAMFINFLETLYVMEEETKKLKGTPRDIEVMSEFWLEACIHSPEKLDEKSPLYQTLSHLHRYSQWKYWEVKEKIYIQIYRAEMAHIRNDRGWFTHTFVNEAWEPLVTFSFTAKKPNVNSRYNENLFHHFMRICDFQFCDIIQYLELSSREYKKAKSIK